MGRGAVALLILSVLLAGCIPVFDNPVTAEKSATYDERLTGLWVSTGGEGGNMLIGKNAGTLNTRIVLSEFKADGGLKVTQHETFSSRVGERSFFNVRDKIFMVVNYGFNDKGELYIALPEEKGFRDAIEGKKLKGETFIGRDYNVSVTASSQELAAFLAKADLTTLFGEKVFFKKVR